MKLIYHWIAEWVDLSEISPEELGEKLTKHSAEMEAVHNEASDYENMVLGVVLELEAHPNADRLRIAKVDIGQEAPVSIVCGGTNLSLGMKVAVALPNSQVRWHGEGELVTMKVSAVRGIESYGMICAGEEIGLTSDNPEGSSEVRIHDLSWSEEKAGTALAQVLQKNNITLEIDNKSITHRPDLWGHYGFAREASAIFKRKLVPLDSHLYSGDLSQGDKISLEIVNPELSKKAHFIRVDGVAQGESPLWLKRRLETCGIKSNGVLVDITNYVMLELGQPMHAYDVRHVSEGFRIRYAKADEKLTLLNGTEENLFEKDIVIADKSDKALILAGVKGGLYSGIQEDTTSIYLEAAHWDPILIRTSSQKHGLRTDASQRYEKSLDPEYALLGLRRALALLQKLFPTMSLGSALSSWEPELAKPQSIPFSTERFRRYTGLNLEDKAIAENLEALGFKVDKNAWLVEVPSFRATGDVSLEEDLIEEVARIHGYDAIPSLMPELPTHIPSENAGRRIQHKLRNIFAYENKGTEMNNYSFYSEKTLGQFRLKAEDHFRLLNPLSEENSHMRLSLVPNLVIKAIANGGHASELSLFELGRSYHKQDAFMPKEKASLALVKATLSKKDSKQKLFHDILKEIDTMFARLKSPTWKLVPSQNPPAYAHSKLCYDILFQGKSLGNIFALHPQVLSALDTKLQMCAMEIDTSALEPCLQKILKFEEPSKFPSTHMDISVLVPEKSLVGDWMKLMSQADKQGWITHIELKDIYQGDPIPQGQKSISFALEIQNPSGTVDEAHFRELQEKIFVALEEKNGIIRGR